MKTGFSRIKKKILILIFVLFLPIPAAMGLPPSRIVSLAPNVTEVLYDLGLGDRIVAVSTYCNYPPDTEGKPKIGGMSNPSLEAIVALKPDMVVLTDDGNPQMIQQRLTKLNIRTYVFRARRLNELPGAIRKLGRVLDVGEQGDRSARRIEKALKKYEARERNTSPTARRRALFVIQTAPLMVAGRDTAIDDIMNVLGLRNIAADAPNKYPHFSLEEVLRRMPDIIFIVKTHDNENRQTAQFLKRIRQTEAVRHGRVIFVGDPLLRVGPRLADGMDEMAGSLETQKNRSVE
ncbi:MAG: ABC transporter substrate-binding protein [Deltaproteobacteria bacterium]|nr:ABC transporter substrate-binding protein [Deltaproteobacteria bacterium]